MTYSPEVSQPPRYTWGRSIGAALPPVRLVVTREDNNYYRVERDGDTFGWVLCVGAKWRYCRHPRKIWLSWDSGSTAPSWKAAVIRLCREYRTHGGGYIERRHNCYVTSLHYGGVWYTAIQRDDRLQFIPENPKLTEAEYRNTQMAQAFFKARLARNTENDHAYHNGMHFRGIEEFDSESS